MPGTKADESVRRGQIRGAAYEIAAESGVRAITIRDVAERAGLSPGLILFHYGSKEQLVLDVLGWVLETTTALNIGPEIAAIKQPGERLLALLRQEMERIAGEPRRIRLFFEFWSAGLWDPAIGTRMQAELDRYREAFRPMAEAVLRADPALFPGVTPAGLAAVVVSFIKGCAVQSLIEPELDIREFIGAAEGLLAQLSRIDGVRSRVKRSVGSGSPNPVRSISRRTSTPHRDKRGSRGPT
ncbi:MAG: TetR/AcrR family transcriptional regulator [Gemmatimonadaceae bacterium]